MGNGPVQAGQTNPHLPGFNPSSVPFINTPVGGAPGVTGSLGGAGTLVLGQRGALVPSTLVFSRSCSRAVVPVRLLLRLVAAAYWAG
jgi:hypothetical protein